MTAVALAGVGVVGVVFVGAVIGLLIAERRTRTDIARYEAAVGRYEAAVDLYQAEVDRFVAAKYGGQIAVFQAELDQLEGWPR